MIQKAQLIPDDIPQDAMLPVLAMTLEATCPRVAAVLHCPGDRAVAFSLTRTSIAATVQAHRYVGVKGGRGEVQMTAEVQELLVSTYTGR